MDKRIVTDEELLRRVICGVLKFDLSEGTGWREGSSWYMDKVEVSDALVKRGVLTQEGDRFYLSEAALMRAIRVAVDATVADLLVNDPPENKLPEIPSWAQEEDNARLVMLDEPVIR